MIKIRNLPSTEKKAKDYFLSYGMVPSETCVLLDTIRHLNMTNKAVKGWKSYKREISTRSIQDRYSNKIGRSNKRTGIDESLFMKRKKSGTTLAGSPTTFRIRY